VPIISTRGPVVANVCVPVGSKVAVTCPSPSVATICHVTVILDPSTQEASAIVTGATPPQGEVFDGFGFQAGGDLRTA